MSWKRAKTTREGEALKWNSSNSPQKLGPPSRTDGPTTHFQGEPDRPLVGFPLAGHWGFIVGSMRPHCGALWGRGRCIIIRHVHTDIYTLYTLVLACPPPGLHRCNASISPPRDVQPREMLLSLLHQPWRK